MESRKAADEPSLEARVFLSLVEAPDLLDLVGRPKENATPVVDVLRDNV
jgi:hypothetical protein